MSIVACFLTFVLAFGLLTGDGAWLMSSHAAQAEDSGEMPKATEVVPAPENSNGVEDGEVPVAPQEPSDPTAPDTDSGEGSVDQPTDPADAGDPSLSVTDTEKEGEPLPDAGIPADGETDSGHDSAVVMAEKAALLDASKTVTRIAFRYLASPDSDDPAARPIDYDPDSPSVPTIGETAGTMNLYATIIWSDGSREEVAVDACSWAIVGTVDEAGRPTDNRLARIIPSGRIKALTSGNGTITVRCTYPLDPNFPGQDIKIRIVDNAGPSVQLNECLKYCKNVDTGVWELIAGGSGAHLGITSAYGSCTVDSYLVFSDGTEGYGGALGESGNWRITAAYDTKGNVIDGNALASVNNRGVVTAKRAGNGAVDIEWNSAGRVCSATIRIEGNAIPGSSEVTPSLLSYQYTDSTHPLPTPYSENESPTILTVQGSAQLIARIFWSDGTLGNASDAKYATRWEVVGTTDLHGKPISQMVALPSSDGTVFATGAGDGIVELRCSLVGRTVESVPSTVKVIVRGNSGVPYVSKVEIVRADDTPYGDDAINIDEVGKVIQFYAKVTYRDGTVKSTARGDFIEDLVWASERGLNGAVEWYSKIDPQTGFFTAESGFKEAFVFARIKGGDFFGNDVYKWVRVYSTQEDTNYGSTSEVTVHIIHKSEYDKNGLNGTPAKEETVTAAQINTLALSSNQWFTYRKKNNGWGTAYTYGASIQNFITLVGVDPKDLIYIKFADDAGYAGDTALYSATTIFSSQYRYTNFYMHAASSNAGYLGQNASPAPVIATSTSFDFGNDFTGGGYSKMTSANCIRFVLGMTSIEDRNASRMVRCVSDITMVISDPVKDEEDPPEITDPDPDPKGTPGSKGSGDQSGSGTGLGGGYGSEGGSASQGQGGGDAAGGSGTGGRDSGDVRLRELVDNKLVIPPIENDSPWRSVSLGVALSVLVAGGLRSGLHYRSLKRDGERVEEV